MNSFSIPITHCAKRSPAYPSTPVQLSCCARKTTARPTMEVSGLVSDNRVSVWAIAMLLFTSVQLP